MKIITTIILTAVFLITTLYIANYHTLFAYYLPHKPQVVYMASGDISVHFHHQFFTINKGATWGIMDFNITSDNTFDNVSDNISDNVSD